MTTEQQIAMVKALSDETDDNVISAFLSMAESVLYNYIDPFHTLEMQVAVEPYPDVVVSAAAYMLNKRGWDYQVTYTENGVRREYESGDLPASILNRITPIAKVMG